MTTLGPFSGEYRWLSNFWIAPMAVRDPYLERNIVVRSVEHGYQADKSTAVMSRLAILNAWEPRDAKRIGRNTMLAADWDTYRFESMRYWIMKKFTQHENLCQKLLATGTAELIEINTWGDTFWGVCKGVGENHLGKTLMDVRSELVTHVEMGFVR